MNEKLLNIKETMCGYPVKNLKYSPLDNIIVGLVKDPLTNKETLHDGYVSCTWRKNGKVTSKFGGVNRSDLYLDIDHV